MNKRLRNGLIIAAVVIASGALVINGLAAGSRPITVETSKLSKIDLVQSVSATGTVESKNATVVYSYLAATINEVNVEVGDVVLQGDILAQIDSESLEISIAQQKASIGAASAGTSHQVNVASEGLDNVENTLDSGLNMSIITAQAGVDNALIAYNSAKDRYDTIENMIGDSSSGGFVPITPIAPGTSLTPGTGTGTGTGTGSLTSTTVEDAKTALTSAETAYNTAKKTLHAALNAAGIEISSYENNLKGAKISNNYSAQWLQVKQLELQLEQSTVKAPQDGVVTAVYAKVGASGTGLLFVVESPEELKIATTIKEHNLASVKEGQKVIIRSDSTGDAQFEGIVDSIAPAANKSPQGETISMASPEFATIIAVSDDESQLRIGINARMEIITEEKKNILAVLFDLIATNENGDDVVFILQEGEEGKFYAKEIVLETGMETDLYTEVLNSDLFEGVEIIRNPELLKDGEEVVILEVEK